MFFAAFLGHMFDTYDRKTSSRDSICKEDMADLLRHVSELYFSDWGTQRKLQQELAEKEDLGESDGARGTRPSEDAGHENSQI